jgi:tetratricopeptide (TPR) repeat protein
VAPLISRGATASLGNVYEPYLQLTNHLNIFNDRLLHGFTFAESAYMSIQALSWMNVMVGDPLYRPYASWLQIDASRDSGKTTNEWKMYHDFALKNLERPAPEYRTLARQVASRARNGPMIEDLGLMEAADGNFAAATSYFQQARACYTKRDDILRAVLEEADGWIKQKKPKRALDVVRSTLRIVPDAPAAALLRKIEQDLTAPAPTPLTSPTRP